MKKLLSLVVLVLGVQAHAGVIVEPFIGYDSSSLKTTDIGGTTGSATNSGMDFGARLGYRFGQGFWVAAEYAGGSGKSKNDTTEQDYSKSAMSAVFGYDMGRFNVWAGYGFSDKITLKNSGSPDTDITGTNLKVGVGFEAVNHVALNLEYLMPKYTKLNAGSGDVTISDFYSKFDTSGVMFSVSFPFDLSK